MRIKFWRDTLNSIYSTSSPNQPVAVALREAVRTKKLSKQWLTRLLDARESNLDDRLYVTLKDVEDYAENTSSSTLYLTLEAVGVRDVQSDHAASHLGKAEGIVTLLRATPYHAHNKKVFLPMELLALHRLSQEDVLRRQNSSSLQDVVYDVASQANMHLNMARSLSSKMTSDAKTCLLPAISCSSFLDAIQKCNFNVFDGRLQQRAALLPLALLWHRLWRKY
ncbi:NADH dehydrogenase (ubiquinone) complex I, assembly factor 6-like isoform X2 [Corticium candelabrum]|nr:NADH dehydrogenase (ubiquinone) complex I, assembly factor 6-like isoform X2 [Corticium candelabrum]